MSEARDNISQKKIKKEIEDEIKLKDVLIWIKTNLKFLLIPGYSIEDLTLREFEYEKKRSKRRFISRFKQSMTIVGIAIVFIITTMAVFPEWIAPYTCARSAEIKGVPYLSAA